MIVQLLVQPSTLQKDLFKTKVGGIFAVLKPDRYFQASVFGLLLRNNLSKYK